MLWKVRLKMNDPYKLNNLANDFYTKLISVEKINSAKTIKSSDSSIIDELQKYFERIYAEYEDKQN